MIWVQLLMWVVSFILTDYFRERLPSQTASGIGDFNIPTATEGRPVPICIGGTVRFEGPNCIWYGDFIAEERTVTTGVIFTDEETIGFTYFLALQYALFKGPSAGITGVWIGDDRVFDAATDSGGIPQPFVDIDRDDLFGGEDGGGGFQGRIRLFDGSETQAVSAFLDTRIDPLPAYRGLSYIMVTSLDEAGGANIGESNQLRFIRVELQTFDTLAGATGHPGLGDSLSLGNDHHFIGPDLNPIVAAWDVWTNQRWGRGFGLSDVDIASFQAAAETCWTEGIGWTNVQDEQTTTGAIQDLVEQHVDGYIGPNPLTGLIEVTLARPDYVVLSLPLVIDVGMSANLLEVKQWDQGDWSNTKNRIRIRYTSRDKDWKETHAVETAAGNRIIQGRTATEEVRFPGCHTPAVASVIAAREKRGLSLPLQKGTILVNRTTYELRPGQVFRLTSAQAEVTDLPVRVTKMSLGDTTNQSIELSVVEDIFGNEPNTVAPTPPSDFVPPVQVVNPMLVADQAAFESPFILMRGNPQPNTVPRITTLARRAPGNAMIEYEVIRRTGNPPAGAYTSTDFVAAGFTSVGTLRNNEPGPISGQSGFSMQIDPIGAESLDGLINIYGPGAGNFAGVAVIGPGLVTEEFIIFDEIVDDLGGIRLENVWRACMDTFWKSHNAGERIWFIWTGGMGMGLETYAQGLGVEMKFLPRSPNDAVVEGDAVPLPVVTIDDNTGNRQNKPLLPADVFFNVDGEWPATANFDRTIVPQSGGNYVGQQLLPQHRLWRTQDILLSVKGLDIGGGGINPGELDGMDVSIWLHDLDVDPTAQRANAIFEVLNQVVVTATDEIKIPKADMVAGGAVGIQFNARLEIETRHAPTGSPSGNISHLPGFFDFLATGIFSLEADQVSLATQLNGEDGDQFGIDEYARPMLFVGDAQIDTASSEYGGGSLIFDGVGDAVHIVSAVGFDWYTGEWTIDFRIRFDDIVSAQVIIGQAWIGPDRSWYLEWDGNSFEFRFSRSGSDGPFTNIGLGAFAPNAGQWYVLRLVQAKEPSSPRFSCYIDGTRTGSTFTAQSNKASGHDWILGARHDGGGVYTAPFTGQIDELEVRNFAAIDPAATSYVLDTERPAYGPSSVADVLIANFEGADTATVFNTDDVNRGPMTFGATTQLDTAQFMFGTASLRCDGVDNLTPASADGVWLPETLFPSPVRREWNLERLDWTMEGFVRFAVLPTAPDGSAMIGKYNRPSGNTVDWGVYFGASDNLVFYYSPTGNISGGVQISVGVGLTIAVDTWYHWAIQRRGDDLEHFFEGDRLNVEAGWFAGNRVFNQDSNPVTLGRFYDASVLSRIRAMDGWLDGMRVRVGDTIYADAATYTIPTVAPSVGDQGERDLLLLHHFEGSDFFATDGVQETDDGQRGTRITFISGARYLDFQPKFGVTHGDAGVADGFGFTESKFFWALGDGDFTIDIWFQNNDTEAQQANNGVAFFNHWLEAGDNRGWRFSFDKATSRLEFIWTTDGTTIDERTAFVSSFNFDATFQDNATMVHVAVERDGGVINIYLDGVIQTLDAASDIIGTDVIFNVAQRAIQVGIEDESTGNKTANGYWDEFRFIKRAAYGSASFTPETSAYSSPVAPNV